MGLIRQLCSGWKIARMRSHLRATPPRVIRRTRSDSHVWLLGRPGLMKVVDVTSVGFDGPHAIPLSLTWEGHDFIAAARGDTPLGARQGKG